MACRRPETTRPRTLLNVSANWDWRWIRWREYMGFRARRKTWKVQLLCTNPAGGRRRRSRKEIRKTGRPSGRPFTMVPMPDAAEQLQRIYLAGFELQTFDRYPNAVGLIKGGCIALVRPAANGLEL